MRKYEIKKDECLACGNCAEICDNDAIDILISKNKTAQRYSQYVIDQDKCIGCGKCIKNCLNEAIYEVAL